MSFKKNALRVAIITAIVAPTAMFTSIALANEPVSVQQEVQAGSLQGNVITESGGQSLQGAVVTIEGSGQQATTGRDGGFLFPSLPAGSHNLVIDYMGFDSATVTVTVVAGERELVQVPMSGGVFTMQGMEVLGMRSAQARAMNQQRASDKIVNVVSADTLGEFPDVSIAGSVARIAGVSVTRHRGDANTVVIRGGNPQWTKVTVNGMDMPSAGNDRSVALGTVSSDIVSGVEVTKAPTADMPADAIGGTVNIVTRGALDSDKPFVNLKLAGGLSELGNKTNYDAAISVGGVMGERDKIGLMASYSKSSVDRLMNNMEADHEKVDGVWMPDRVQTKAYNILRERESFELRADYMNAAKDNHLYASYARNNYLADEDRHNVSLRNNGDYADGSNAITGTWEKARIEQTWTDRHDETTQDIITIGGSREFDGIEWDYTGSYSTAQNYRKPGRTTWAYRLNTNDDMNYDFSNPDFPVLTFADSGEVPNIGGNIDPDSLSFRHGSNNLNQRDQNETAYQLQSNVLIPMDFGDSSSLKLGVRAIDRKRTNNENRFIITAGGPSLSDILGGEELNNFGVFPYGSRFDKGATELYKDGMTTEESIQHAYSNDYDIKETVTAAYGMGTVDLGDLRLIGGVRAEHTKTSSKGYRTEDNWATIPEQTSYDRSYTNLFPSLHAKYDLTANTILRAAYTTGISRPSFSNLRPTVNVNEENQSVSTSNMTLEPEMSQAIDLMVEHYFQPMGAVSAGVFFKNVDDYHMAGSRAGVVGENINGYVIPEAGFTVNETTNSPNKSTIQGLELSYDQALTFLPSPFDGLGVYANYTYTNSSTIHPVSGLTVPLGAQPDDTINLAVYYEKGNFGTRLAYNYQSKRISNYGDGQDENLLWWDERSIVDLTAKYRINDNVSIYGEAMNLTDTLARRYRGDKQRVEELEGFGRTYMLGLRANF